MSETRHDPTWYSAKGERWCVCTCGWKSRVGTANLVQVEFGGHLISLWGVSTADLLAPRGEP